MLINAKLWLLCESFTNYIGHSIVQYLSCNYTIQVLLTAAVVTKYVVLTAQIVAVSAHTYNFINIISGILIMILQLCVIHLAQMKATVADLMYVIVLLDGLEVLVKQV